MELEEEDEVVCGIFIGIDEAGDERVGTHAPVRGSTGLSLC